MSGHINSAEVEAARAEVEWLLTQSTGRVIVGVVGPPGAGKSTFAEAVVAAVGRSRAALVPMDGFHLANTLLEGTPLKQRKGAIDTFDVGGYLSLLRRLRTRDEKVVYAPDYRRGLEEPIAASISISADIPIVITEGNYLLAEAPPWDSVRSLLDHVWYVRVAETDRIGRLIDRHTAFGMTSADATAWANGPDQQNANLIEQTAARADTIVQWD